MRFAAGGLRCELSFGNRAAVETARLLRDYRGLDARVPVLGTALRRWAVHAGVLGEGLLPPHALAVLLVRFLQVERVLPCIHAWLPPGETREYRRPPEFAGWTSDNTASAAALWVDLFRWLALSAKVERVITIRREADRTNFKGKRLTVEDPYSSRRNLCKDISLAGPDFLVTCFKTSYLYFGTIQTTLGPVIEEIVEREEEEAAMPRTLEAWLAARGTRVTAREAAVAVELVPRNMVRFTMATERLVPGPPPLPVCEVCGGSGHRLAACPEEALPERPELPRLEPRCPETNACPSVCPSTGAQVPGGAGRGVRGGGGGLEAGGGGAPHQVLRQSRV